MNPRDIMTDAIHNFHPQYQQYTQYSSTASTKVIIGLFISTLILVRFATIIFIMTMGITSTIVHPQTSYIREGTFVIMMFVLIMEGTHVIVIILIREGTFVIMLNT